MAELGSTVPFAVCRIAACRSHKPVQPATCPLHLRNNHRSQKRVAARRWGCAKARRRYPWIRDHRRGVAARPGLEIQSLAIGPDMTTEQAVAAPPSTYRQLLRLPGFRQLLISSLLTRTASQMWTVGLVLFALQRYHSPSVAGVSLFLLIFPGLLLSPIAGALLDRHGRKRLMTLDFSVAAVCLTVIVVLAAANLLPVWGLYVAAGRRLAHQHAEHRGRPLVLPTHRAPRPLGPGQRRRQRAVTGSRASPVRDSPARSSRLIGSEAALAGAAVGYVVGAHGAAGRRRARSHRRGHRPDPLSKPGAAFATS